ncbi:MAG TPA: hypothetical protein VGK19_02700 [Capsulimonadaceae bacterium]
MQYLARLRSLRFALVLTVTLSLLAGVGSAGKVFAQTFDVTIDLTSVPLVPSNTYYLNLQSTGPSGATFVSNITTPPNSVFISDSHNSNSTAIGNSNILLSHPGGAASNIDRRYADPPPFTNNMFHFTVIYDPSNSFFSTFSVAGQPNINYGSVTYTPGSAPVTTGQYSVSNYVPAPTPTPELSTWVSFGLMLALFSVGLVVKRRTSDRVMPTFTV